VINNNENSHVNEITITQVLHCLQMKSQLNQTKGVFTNVTQRNKFSHNILNIQLSLSSLFTWFTFHTTMEFSRSEVIQNGVKSSFALVHKKLQHAVAVAGITKNSCNWKMWQLGCIAT